MLLRNEGVPLMDPAFIAAAAAVGGAYGWLPLRDQICASRGHRLGREKREGNSEAKVRRTCMCAKASMVVDKAPPQAPPQKRGTACPAPAWVAARASTQSP